MTGNLFLIGAIISTVGAILFCLRKQNTSTRKIKIAAFIAAGSVAAASLYLWFLIFTNNFGIEYVASYSSTTLPTVYKVSAFWAGQQGSFLFWLLIHSFAGIILVTRKIQEPTLGIYFFLQIILIVLVIAKSPFAPNPAEVVEGVGLNPLLQDFWMAIHPPIIFVGYALLAIPFSFALGNVLTSPASKNWLEVARKWTLVAWSFLGAGIFVGGYWAYKVLGWGGYWGWDPVENSSLVPWLMTAVLLHLINLAKKKSAVMSITYIAAVVTYATVMYGTFLTRSGILGDFSVHSFAESNIGLFIWIADAIILLGGLFIIFVKAKKFPQGKMYESFGEPAFVVLLSSLLLIFIASIVWVGMSMPLFTQIAGQAGAVDQDFYVKSTSPIAAVLVVLVIYTFIKFREPINFGGKIAHAGFVLGLAAIVISSHGETVTQEFKSGEEINFAGHKIIYEGQVFEEENRQKFFVCKVDGQEVKALTKLRGNGEDAAREPGISKNFSGDVYIAPHPTQNFETREIILTKGRVEMDGEIMYSFDDAAIEYDEKNNPVRATAKISVNDGVKQEIINPLITVTPDGGTSKSIEFLDGRRRVRLTGISGDLEKARLEILPTYSELHDTPVTLTISTKPFIWLLWLSVAAICAGTFAAVKKF